MGRDTIVFSSGEISTETGGKTMLQIIADAETDLTVEEIYVSGKRAPVNSSDVPMLFMVRRENAAGTGGVAVTPKAWPGATGATKIGTANAGPTAAAWGVNPTEPGTTERWIHREIPTVAPGYTWRGQLLIPATYRVGFWLNSAANITALVEVFARRS